MTTNPLKPPPPPPGGGLTAVKDSMGFLADLGKARGCSTNSLVIHSFIKSVITFLPQLYGAAMPKRFEIALPVIKWTMS